MAKLSIDELIREGSAAMRVGEAGAARSFFEQALDLDDRSIAAWLGYAGAVETLSEKERCFRRVLALEPDNAEAHAGLEWAAKSGAHDHGAAHPDDPTGTLYCANHPNTETLLRCNRCGKPICTRCAVRTPVGYRCKECVAELQGNYFTARSYDYPIAGAITFVASIIAGAIVPWVGSLIPFYGWIAMIFVAPAVAGGLAEIVRRSVAKRRGRYLWVAVSAAAIAGSLVGVGLAWLFIGAPSLLTFGIYIVLLVSTLYARTR